MTLNNEKSCPNQPIMGNIRVIVLTEEQQKDIEAIMWFRVSLLECVEAKPFN